MELKESLYSFKSSEDTVLFSKLDIILQMIFIDLCIYCERNNLPRPTITSTIRDRLKISVSDTHAEGRALDIRSRVYSRIEIDKICRHINDKFGKEFGTCKDRFSLPRCLIYEEFKDNPDNNHFHLQVKRDALQSYPLSYN